MNRGINMTQEQIMFAILSWLILTAIIYTLTGWRNIRNCYAMWFTKKYWTNYNIIEAASWVAKAIIIIPGLIFGVQIWQFYFIALVTSLSLIWASNKKLLPTLVGFNTLWIWLSMMVIAQHVI
jgi:hypothetical protein